MSGPSSDTPRIFVSHSHEDDAFCQHLIADLRARLGEDAVWYDASGGLHGGDDWWNQIAAEITARPYFLVVLSPHADASGWVRQEMGIAFRQHVESGKRLLPLRIAPSPRRPDWAGIHEFDFQAHADEKRYAAALVELLRVLGVDPDARGPAPSTQAPATPPAQVVFPGRPAPATAPAAAPVRAPTPTPASSNVPVPAPVPTPAPAFVPARPNLSRERYPECLERLGFVAAVGRDPKSGKEVTYIRAPLCPVPAGPFLMGSDPTQDSQARANEQPQITVELPAYQIGRFPVTVAEYACFVAEGHKEPQKTWWAFGLSWNEQLMRLDHPVVNVTWSDARDYVAWLAKLTGQPWALPSEAEWEKAARWDVRGNTGRGVARIYPWGDHFDTNRCNTSEANIGTTTAVGTCGPRDSVDGRLTPERDGSGPYGAQDMAGNVVEWTRTIWDRRANSKMTFREDDNSTAGRVLRGGSWDDSAGFARAACRSNANPVDFLGSRGFRVVLRA